MPSPPLPAPGQPAPGSAADNQRQLRALFPQAFVGGRLDMAVLSQLLGAPTPGGAAEEKYGLSWHGKRAARQQALSPAAVRLRPAPAEGLHWDTTRNLLLEGDNLDVLKLLQASYAGQVKLMYIDPPYNTGKDFVYRDNFQRSRRGYRRLTGQPANGDGAPDEAEAAGRLHTDWLNLLYPRLQLARQLLRDDGVLFLSIDDNEVANACHLLNELFGEENRLAIICHKARASVSNDNIISASHNFILLYAKDRGSIFARRRAFGLPPDLTGYTQHDERGAFKYVPVDGPGGAAKGNPHYTFLGVTGYFRFAPERMQAMHAQGLIVKVGNGLQQKHYRRDAEQARKTDTTWWDGKYYTATASARLKALMGADVFDAPKPVELVQRMLQLWAREPDDLVMDFFAGSGTTGHAVMAQNALDGGTRRFVLVQLPEPLDPARRDQTQAAAYCQQLGRPLTIAELTKERLRRAAAQLQAQHPGTSADLGFRVYSLSAPPAPAARPSRALVPESELLTTLLLQAGLPLTAPIVSRSAGGHTLHALSGGRLLACLSPRLPEAEELARHLAAWHAELSPGQVPQVAVRTSACPPAGRAALLTALARVGLGDAGLRLL